jgi:hypothetical protein
VKRFGLAFIVSAGPQRNRYTPEKTLSRVEFSAQAGHFRAMRERAWVRFQHGRGQ